MGKLCQNIDPWCDLRKGINVFWRSWVKSWRYKFYWTWLWPSKSKYYYYQYYHHFRYYQQYLYCHYHYHRLVVVVNHSMANTNANLVITNFKYNSYFPTNCVVISMNVCMIVKLLQVCDLEFSLTVRVHYITSPCWLHSAALVIAQ